MIASKLSLASTPAQIQSAFEIFSKISQNARFQTDSSASIAKKLVHEVISFLQNQIAAGQLPNISSALIDVVTQAFDPSAAQSFTPSTGTSVVLPSFASTIGDTFQYSSVTYDENIYASLSPGDTPSSPALSINLFKNGAD